MLTEMLPPCIARAENDLLFDEQGIRYIDLFSAHGATWLGHSNPEIASAMRAQIEKVWLTGGLPTKVGDEAKASVEGFFPLSHGLAGLYSTGMEAAEFTLRIARIATRRVGAVGFERSMHGKSLATAYLGWDNHDGLSVPFLNRLPFLPNYTEGQVLTQLQEVLREEQVSAVFIEPVQGCGGGHAASKEFHRDVFRLCSENGALLVFDEILTGFYRTGNPFFFSDLGFVPDIVLLGKAMGNGFPVAGVIVNKKYAIQSAMLPGSTYAGNPLAACAVSHTLRRMRLIDMPQRVALIENAVAEILGPLRKLGIAVRGRGAIWILELPAGDDLNPIIADIYRRGVCVGFTERQIRILPPATIEIGNLVTACGVVRDVLCEAYCDA